MIWAAALTNTPASEALSPAFSGAQAPAAVAWQLHVKDLLAGLVRRLAPEGLRGISYIGHDAFAESVFAASGPRARMTPPARLGRPAEGSFPSVKWAAQDF